MPHFVVSDLHLGDRGPRDNFAVGDRERQFRCFLQHVEKQGGQLVICGDLFDFWQANLSKVLVMYDDLLIRLAGLKAVYVVGNHDADLAHFVGHPLFTSDLFFCRMRGPFTLTIGGRRFKFQHGHEADEFCRDDAPGFGRITSILSGMLEDKNKSPILGSRTVEEWFIGGLEILHRLYDWLHGRRGRDKRMVRGVLEAATKEGADVAIAGHTHQPGRVGDRYYNCGSWCGHVNSFVRIEDDGRAAVFDWINGSPIPNQTILTI